ncbi:MAG TPA: M14 family zinc carboxypeptidase [Pyrinomonadaceae bacterium]|jgi:hypothetical protein|nr:M14 family zinc carboxypeptidase [Pyrinomonadaceae bacterium]
MKTAPSFVKTCLIVGFFQLVSCGFAVAQGTAGDARIAVRVYFTSENDRQQLEQTMSVDEHSGGPDYVMVSMTVDEMSRLVQSGRRAERDDVYTAEWFHPAKWLPTAPAGPLDLDGVHSFAAIQQFFNQKAAAYPNFTESITIGPSWCKTQADGCRQFDPLVQTKGSDLRVLKITNKNIPGPKPILWIDAGIHANELEPPELLMKFVSWLLDGYNIDPDARWLVDSREIHVLLIRNPDGREFVEQLPGLFVYKKADRKTAHPLGCTIWPTRDSTHERLGVDLNRNSPIEWSSTIDVPCGETYPGSSPLSEPEARAVHDYLQKIFSSRLPANGEPAPLSTSGTFLNMHSAGGTVFVPWNGKDYCPPNQRDLVNLALHMNAKHYGDAPGTPIQYSGGFVCQPSDPDARCYPPSSYPATTVDTAYGELGNFC